MPSGSERTPAFSPAWPIGAFAVFAVLHFSLLYRPNLVRLDDFGYLQSVVETLTHGRPFTHDSLGPYGASMSGLGALLYLATGDFPLATWGLLSGFACAAFWILYRLLRGRLDPRAAAVSALLAATQPVFWYKCSEYTGHVFSATFALAALWAYRNGRWGGFYAAAFLAFANRQNGLALAALPLYRIFLDQTLPHGSKAKIAAGLAAFGAACLLLHFSMNATLSQTHSVFIGLGGYRLLTLARAAFAGVCLGLALASLFALAWGEDWQRNLRVNLGAPLLPAAVSLLFAVLPLLCPPGLASRVYVEFHTPLIAQLDRHDLLQWGIGLCVPALLWLLDWRRLLRPDAAVGLFLGYALLSSLLGFWYDFYLIDLAVAALFLVLSGPALPGPGRMGFCVAGLLFALHCGWAYGYGILADKETLAIRVYENLERSAGLTPDRMTDAPWGYAGWKLYDHYAAHSAPTASAYFICYLLRDQVVVETELPWRKSFKRGEAPAGAKVLETGTARVGFSPVAYRALDLARADAPPISPACGLPLDHAAYRPKPFPLNKAEWRGYIRARLSQRP